MAASVWNPIMMKPQHPLASNRPARGSARVARPDAARAASSRVVSTGACTAAVVALLACGCRTVNDRPAPTVQQAWHATRQVPADPPAFVPAPTAQTVGGSGVIATVDGAPIDRSQVIDVLLESHGVDILDQLIALTVARRLAEERGITISQADIDAEYDRSLETLLADSKEESPVLRRRAAESLLEQTLRARNTSRREYMIVMERNAILRRLVEPDIRFDEAQLRREFSRLFGERVQIRHIQTASLADLEQVLLDRAAGAEFGVLAVRYSVNRASADRLGLLPPFTADDPDVPEPIRKEAFLLPVGHDSNPIHADGWYHLIRVERRIEAASVQLDDVRDEVERSLRNRLVDAAMRKRYVEILENATVDIADARLKELFYDAHPDHGTAKP